jgi:hypothetical protein
MLGRACPDRSYHISQTRRREGSYSRSKVGAHPRHEAEGYKEVSPEPKDYGDSDYSDDRHVVERRNFHSFSNHVQSDNEEVIDAS